MGGVSRYFSKVSGSGVNVTLLKKTTLSEFKLLWATFSRPKPLQTALFEACADTIIIIVAEKVTYLIKNLFSRNGSSN